MTPRKFRLPPLLRIFGFILLISLLLSPNLAFTSSEEGRQHRDSDAGDSQSNDSQSIEQLYQEQQSSVARGGRVRRGGCYCIRGRGTYCGSTKRIGQISGDCSEHDLYYCSRGGSSLSKWEGKCKRGCFAATGGKDYCK